MNRTIWEFLANGKEHVMRNWMHENKISVGSPVEIQTSAKVEHRLDLRAEGFSDFSTTFVLSPGEIRDFQIVLAERSRS